MNDLNEPIEQCNWDNNIFRQKDIYSIKKNEYVQI